MPKYLSGRVKRRNQAFLSTDRYQYLGLDQAEPNLGDPADPLFPEVPFGEQFQIVTLRDRPGERFWVPVGGGIIPGSISIFDEGSLVGTEKSITQLNFVGAAVSATASPLSVGATITVAPPGLNNSILYKDNGDFASSSFLVFNDSIGIGSVGIGTTDPTENLHVVGNLRLDSTLLTNQLDVVGLSTFTGITTQKSTLFTTQLSNLGVSTFVGVTTFNNQIFTNKISNSGIITSNMIHLTGGSFTAPHPSGDTKNDTAIVVNENFGIYSLELQAGNDNRFLRRIIEKENNILTIGQDDSSLFATINIKPGNQGTVSIGHSGAVSLVGVSQDGNTPNTEKLRTVGTGITVFGNIETQTLNVTGVSTFVGLSTFSSNIFVEGTLDTDQLNVSGISTFNDSTIIDGSLTVGSNHSNVTGGAPTDQGNLAVYGSGKNSLIIQSDFNTLDRGIAWRNSGDAYVSYIAAVNRGGNTVDLRFGVHNSTDASVDNITERMRITKEGNVGIGTTNPDGKLHAYKGSAGDIQADSDANNIVIESNTDPGISFLSPNNEQARIKFADPDDTDVGGIAYNHINDTLTMRSGGVTVIGVTSTTSSFSNNIDANGDLDVDGQTDLDILNVAETATFSGDILPSATDSVNIGGSNVLRFNKIFAREFVGLITTVQENILTENINVTGISTFVGLSTFANGIQVVSGIATFDGNIDANGDLDVDGHTELDDLNVSGFSTFVKNVEFKSRIGIGTDDPDSLLHIVSGVDNLGILSSTDSGANLDLYDDDTRSRFRSVDGRLHIDADKENAVDNSEIRFFIDNSRKVSITTEGHIYFGSDIDNYFHRPDANNLAFVTNNEERLRIKNDGNVGIASATPTHKLEVLGDTLLKGNLIVTGITSASAFADFDYLQAPHKNTVNLFVTVASKSNHRYQGQGSGNAYYINGIEAPVLTLTPGRTYRFNLSSSNMSNHPFRFYYQADRTTEYTTNVTSTGTYTEITITDTTPNVLHYQCSVHGFMGNSVITNSNVVDTPYNATFRGGIDVDGDTTLDITTIDGLLDINAGGQANTFKVEDLTSGRVVLAGTGGELEDSANLKFNGSLLDVTGDGAFSGNLSIAGTLTYEDVTNIDAIGLITARNGIHVTGGKVGIGTTNSASATALTVYRNDAGLGNIALIEQDGTGDAILGFALKGIAAWQFGIDNSDSDKFKISYDGSGLDSSTSITLDRSGNIGVGTNSPKSVLEVAGSAAVLTITDTRNQSFSVGDTLSSLAFDTDDLSGGAGSASHPRAKINLVTENTFGSKTGLSFATKGDTSNAPSEKMRITHGGKVGIGTNNPLRPLHIESSDCRIRLTDSDVSTDVELLNASGNAVLTTNGASQLRLQTNNTQRLIITSDGDIGIGTDNPTGTNAVSSGNASTLAVGILTAREIFGPITGALNPTGSVIIDENLTVKGNTTLGDDDTDNVTINGISTFVGVSTFNNQIFTNEISNSGIITSNMIHLTGGSFTAPVAGGDTKNDSAIIVNENFGIYSLELQPGAGNDNKFLRSIIQKDTNVLTIGKNDTSLFAAINIRPGNSGTVSIGHSGAVSLVGVSEDGFTANTEKLRTVGTGITVFGTTQTETLIVNDKVGIGTTNPQMKLVVSDDGNGIEFNPKVGGTNDHRILAFDRVANVRRGLELDAQSFEYRKDLETRLKILSDGKVGINTDNPGSTLDVLGDIRVSSKIELRELPGGSFLDFDDDNGPTPFTGATNNVTLASISGMNLIYDTNNNDMNGFMIAHGHPNSGIATAVLVIDANDKVGIGTINPLQQLDVRGDIIAYESSSGSVRLVQDGNIEITNNNGGLIDFKTSDTEDFDCRIRQISDGLQFMTGGNGSTDERLRITGIGSIGIGTITPDYTLDFGKSTASTIRLISESNGTAIRIGPGASSNDVTLLRVDGNVDNFDGESDDSNFGFSLKYMGVRTGNNNSFSLFADNQTGTEIEAITVLQDGKVGIKDSSPSYELEVNGTVAATNFDSLSDRRYKTNIQVIENPIEKIMKIDGVSFDWKETNEPSLGVIADNILEVFPEIVSGEDTKSVNYNGLIGVLIEVVKNQQKQIDELRNRLDK